MTRTHSLTRAVCQISLLFLLLSLLSALALSVAVIVELGFVLERVTVNRCKAPSPQNLCVGRGWTTGVS